MTTALGALWRYLAPALGAGIVAVLTYLATNGAGGSTDVQLGAGAGVLTYAGWSRLLSHALDKHKINAQAKIAIAKIAQGAGQEARQLVTTAAQDVLHMIERDSAPIVPVVAVPPAPNTGTTAAAVPGPWVPAGAQSPVDPA